MTERKIGQSGEAADPGPPGYDVIGELGRGGYGVVVLARQRSVGRLVAIKRIRGVLLGGDSGAGGDMVARFRREAQVLAALRHPAIVGVYDLVVTGADLSLVMEYVPGQSLRAAQDRRRAPLSALLTVLADVAAALRYAAEHRVVHRDVKPANVFVLPSGRAKLGDFGIARILGDTSAFQSRPGGVTGTPAYLAPEQITGEGDLSRCDAYSFAVMSYELLTGGHPYPVPGGLAMITAHLTAEPRHPELLVPGFPAAAASVLLAGLAKDPAARPEPRELVQALAAVPPGAWPAVLTAAPGTVWPPPDTALEPEGGRASETLHVAVPWVPTREGELVRPVHRRRWSGARVRWVAVAAAVVLGLGAATAVVAVRRSGEVAVLGVTASVTPGGGLARCPRATFLFTGVIRTNGKAGTVRLRWTEPDGARTAETRLPAARGVRQLRAALRYEVTGAAAFTGAARLHVLAPRTVDSAPVPIRYDCG